MVVLRCFRLSLESAVVAGVLSSCGSTGIENAVPPPFTEGTTPSDSPPTGEAAGAPLASGESNAEIDFGVSDAPTTEIEVACAAQSAASELRQVYLAFAFDVSASMGGNNELRFNTKWVPVVAASRAFFAEPESAALSASVTFFPDADEDTRCTDAAYLMPDVPPTLLPTAAFSTAIDALGYTLGSNTWRSSTPTLAAFNGTVASLRAATHTSSNATSALVMVTDGVPAGCDGVDDIQLVVDAVRNSGVKTFVVGVNNPPGDNAGDNLANLNVIAEAGGTGQAFIVATGDPTQTEADFKAVIDEIRGVAVSCNIEIPLPPAGSVFIPEQVNVTYGSGGSADIRLAYDPDCSVPDTWRYDDPQDPATIVLCSDACARAKREVNARLEVEFGCMRRGVPR